MFTLSKVLKVTKVLTLLAARGVARQLIRETHNGDVCPGKFPDVSKVAARKWQMSSGVSTHSHAVLIAWSKKPMWLRRENALSTRRNIERSVALQTR